MKICFLGAGSSVFAKNILGDCILTPSLGEFDIALHDIDATRLEESYKLICEVNKKYDGKATITKHLDRKEALTGADFIINAIQVGGYKPCTVTDFAIPKKFGLRQTIGDTLGIGGIMRALRTMPVLEEFARDIAEVCPNALFLNYSNPMSMLVGYLLENTSINAVGLCHSVQDCASSLVKHARMPEKEEGLRSLVYGINHMAWLLKIQDKDGNDLYPEIKKRIAKKPVKKERVRHKIMSTFGYFVTESSEHSAEYMPYFLKSHNPSLAKKYKVPLDEYPRRCIKQLNAWKKHSAILAKGEKLEDAEFLNHTRTKEYGSFIIEAVHNKFTYQFNGSVLNTNGLIPNLPPNACVEVPIDIIGGELFPKQCEALPEQLAALNRTNIHCQVLTLAANKSRKLSDLYMAAALDPRTAAELSLDDIKSMCDKLCKEHYANGFMPKYD